MKIRVISATIGIILATIAIVLGGWFFAGAVIALVYIGGREFLLPRRRFFVSSISRTVSMPSSSAMSVSVPLSGLTKKCPLFVFSTTDFRSVPTPGSMTDTNTVPAGQNGAACFNR